jgi:hypothetical protein
MVSFNPVVYGSLAIRTRLPCLLFEHALQTKAGRQFYELFAWFSTAFGTESRDKFWGSAATGFITTVVQSCMRAGGLKMLHCTRKTMLSDALEIANQVPFDNTSGMGTGAQALSYSANYCPIDR